MQSPIEVLIDGQWIECEKEREVKAERLGQSPWVRFKHPDGRTMLAPPDKWRPKSA